MRKVFRKRILAAALGAACMAAGSVAYAELVFLGVAGDVPGGVAGNAILSLNVPSGPPPTPTSETGSVAADPITGNAVCAGDITGGCPSGNNGLRTLGADAAGDDPIDTAGEFAIILDAQETGQDNLINVTDLSVSFYAPGSNTPFHTAVYNGPDLIDQQACVGQGLNCVLAFGLDPAQTGILAAAFDEDIRVGAAATLTGVSGGPDRWFLFNRVEGGFPPAEIPEPEPLALFALGLLGVGAALRRRRKV